MTPAAAPMMSWLEDARVQDHARCILTESPPRLQSAGVITGDGTLWRLASVTLVTPVLVS